MSEIGGESLSNRITRLIGPPERPPMGHHERVVDLNLGLGWIYYGLARLLHPRVAVVVGADRFAALVLDQALHDNVEVGEVIVVDPEPVESTIRQVPMTMDAFVESDAYRELGPVGLVFISAARGAEQAHFDYLAFEPRLEPRGVVLFHDSAGLRHVLDDLAGDPRRQQLDLPFGAGLTLVRTLGEGSIEPLLEGRQARAQQ